MSYIQHINLIKIKYYKLVVIFIVGFVNTQSLPRISILFFESETNLIEKNEINTISNRIENFIVKSGKYDVITTKSRFKVLNEQKFQSSGCVEKSCAVQIGAILGAKYIVTGTVNSFSDQIILSSNIINVETGKIEGVAEFITNDKIDILHIGPQEIIDQLIYGFDKNKENSDPEEIEPVFNLGTTYGHPAKYNFHFLYDYGLLNVGYTFSPNNIISHKSNQLGYLNNGGGYIAGEEYNFGINFNKITISLIRGFTSFIGRDLYPVLYENSNNNWNYKGLKLSYRFKLWILNIGLVEGDGNIYPKYQLIIQGGVNIRFGY